MVGGYLTLLFRMAAVCDIEIDDVVQGVALPPPGHQLGEPQRRGLCRRVMNTLYRYFPYPYLIVPCDNVQAQSQCHLNNIRYENPVSKYYFHSCSMNDPLLYLTKLS